MVKLKATTIFSRLPFITPKENENHEENRKVSFWLEKLHIQGEKVRKDTNRSDDHARRGMRKSHLDNEFQNHDEQNFTQSGINQHTKNIAVKNESDRQRVNDLVKKSNRRIISISSVFPWDLFPNTIEVEESRVTFKFSQFLSSQSHSLNIKDISNVFIESSIFFSALQIVSRTFVQNDIKIGNLHKSDAKEAQIIIEGLRTFAEHNINTSNYEVDELISKIKEFHNAHHA